MSETPDDAPVRDLLIRMTADSVGTSGLDAETLMAVRLAALVAVDAPPASYLMNLEAAAGSGFDIDRVADVLAAVAPIVGTPRVVAAAAGMAKSLAMEIAVAVVDAEEQNEA